MLQSAVRQCRVATEVASRGVGTIAYPGAANRLQTTQRLARDDKISIVGLIFAITVVISLVVVAGYLVGDRLKANRNRLYKTLEDHEALNASSRDEWARGQLERAGEEQEMSRLNSVAIPIAQLLIMLGLIIALVTWNQDLSSASAEQAERIAQLELQVHALAFAPVGDVATKSELDPANAPPLPAGAVAKANPMQQACANLIGRVADAYEKGESSKIAVSLEALVKKMGCQATPAPAQ